MSITVFIICIICIWVLLYVVYGLHKKNKSHIKSYNELLSQKKSSEVRLGLITEQLAPFIHLMDNYPKKENLRFLGTPLDYIYFDEDKIVFIEVKSGESKLSPWQNKLKNLINEKKVYFDLIKVKPPKEVKA